MQLYTQLEYVHVDCFALLKVLVLHAQFRYLILMSMAGPPSTTSDPRVRASGVSPTDDPGQAAEADVIP